MIQRFHSISLVFLAAFALSAAPGQAFEGILYEKTTGERFSANIKTYLSKTGFRREMSFEGKKSANSVMFMNYKNSKMLYTLDEVNKTYFEIDTTRKNDAGRAVKKEFQVKPLGELKVAGLSCKNVLITDNEKGEMEWCASKELSDGSNYERLHSIDHNRQNSESLVKALKDAGAEGFPIRTVVRTSKNKSVTTELVKVEKTSVPSSVFEVPAGYTKQPGLAGFNMPAATGAKDESGNPGGMTPAQRKELFKKLMSGKQ